MNNLLRGLKEKQNFALTENGALTHKSTMNDCLDMFAMGAAMRNRSDEDVILMFRKAFKEDALTALKLAFYIRDVRGGQGERRFFRVVMRDLASSNPEVVCKNMHLVPEFGRWDDLYVFEGTKCHNAAFDLLKKQFDLDMDSKTPSLLGKWLKSENASSLETKRLGRITREYFGLSAKKYRKALTSLREKINVLEVLMSQNRWEEIEFDKIPSRAGLIYKNAFARRDLIAQKYEDFAKSEETKVNASTLYPYEVVEKTLSHTNWYSNDFNGSDVDRAMLNKYWENLKDYFNGQEMNGIAMVDTSGSMCGTPINVAISLGLYMAERSGGPFANHYISFSSKPQLIETEGIDFVDKVMRIYATNLVENTNIEAAFDLILETALATKASQSDLPQNIFVISDMEFDSATRPGWRDENFKAFTKENANTLLEEISLKYSAHGYEMPHLVFWNVDARQNNVPITGSNRISYVSGFSPSIFESVITGKTGYDLMMEVVNKDRYSEISL